jgi:LacI family transcriptional regulator
MSRSTNRLTIVDVAQAAGVAPMTVSRYLNQHPNLSQKTAKRIKMAIDQLGYEPNHAARMLMGQPSKVIGLIVPSLADAFFSIIANTVQGAAAERGYLVWIASSNSKGDIEQALIRQMRRHLVDGILLIPSQGGYSCVYEPSDPPVIAVDRPIDGLPLDCVVVENQEGSRIGVEHLISHGYQKIVCLGAVENLITMRDRVSGYEAALRQHGLNVHPVVDCDGHLAAKAALSKLLSGRQPMRALFTLNNLATMRAFEALDDMNVCIPEQVALLGFDDFELAAALKPRLSVVSQPIESLGREAARLLLDRLVSKTRSMGLRTALPVSLIVRQSCGCSPEETAKRRSMPVAVRVIRPQASKATRKDGDDPA